MRIVLVTAVVMVVVGSVRGEVHQAGAPATVDGFIARVHTTATGPMRYRLFVPEGYDRTKKYPLVLWLHGGGGGGTDNLSQITGDQIPGTRFWTTPAAQAKYPSFVLVPQVSPTWLPADGAQVLDVLEVVGKEFSIDASRIYVAGQSVGGRAAVNLLFERPRLFAAAVVLCAAPDLGRTAADNEIRVATIAHVPIWGFQGDQDRPDFADGMRGMIALLRKAGGHPRYTEYPGVGHDVWSRAFKEPELLDWVFSQRLSQN